MVWLGKAALRARTSPRTTSRICCQWAAVAGSPGAGARGASTAASTSATAASRSQGAAPQPPSFLGVAGAEEEVLGEVVERWRVSEVRWRLRVVEVPTYWHRAAGWSGSEPSDSSPSEPLSSFLAMTLGLSLV